MKKKYFILIVDVFYYLLFTTLSIIITLSMYRSLELSGDSGIGIIVDFYILIFVIPISLITQIIVSLLLNNNNFQKLLNIKKIFFLIQNVLILSFDMWCIIMWIFNTDMKVYIWLLYFLLFISMSNIIYYYMVKELGKKLKWGDESD
jgi:hypothetical protein